MTVGIVSSDLLISTRIADAAARAGLQAHRVDRPQELATGTPREIVFVDWAAREEDWASVIIGWASARPEASRPRIILFGPHTDLAAHAAAREAGLGPMMARSKLIADLPRLLETVAPGTARSIRRARGRLVRRGSGRDASSGGSVRR